jgi:hypothetical protein
MKNRQSLSRLWRLKLIFTLLRKSTSNPFSEKPNAKSAK